MKKLFSILVVLLVLSGSVSALQVGNLDKNSLFKRLRDKNELQKYKDNINNILGQLPRPLKATVAGTDRSYEVRISGYGSLGVVMKDGKVISITKGTPQFRTHYADMSYQTLLTVMNDDNQFIQAVLALVNGKIRISKAAGCSRDEQCKADEVCDAGRCRDAFTIAVVPIKYGANEGSKFLNDAKPELGLFMKYMPINQDLVRVHYIDPSVCPNYQCKDTCRDCQATASSCAKKAGLAGVADKVFGISKEDTVVYVNNRPMLICGCAGGIPSYTSVSRARKYVPGGVYCYNTVPHEAGHQLNLWHVDSTGEEAGACQGVNKADCKQSNKASDIMGYGWPQDHFGPAALSYLKSSPLKDYQG